MLTSSEDDVSSQFHERPLHNGQNQPPQIYSYTSEQDDNSLKPIVLRTDNSYAMSDTAYPMGGVSSVSSAIDAIHTADTMITPQTLFADY